MSIVHHTIHKIKKQYSLCLILITIDLAWAFLPSFSPLLPVALSPQQGLNLVNVLKLKLKLRFCPSIVHSRTVTIYDNMIRVLICQYSIVLNKIIRYLFHIMLYMKNFFIQSVVYWHTSCRSRPITAKRFPQGNEKY